MKYLSMLGVLLLVVGAVACSKSRAKPLVPLLLESGVKPQAVSLTEQGTQAYQASQFDDAKSYFSQAVAAAPHVLVCFDIVAEPAQRSPLRLAADEVRQQARLRCERKRSERMASQCQRIHAARVPDFIY